MALRILTIVAALTMVISSGCRTTARYQPPCPPAVVGTAPVVAPACPGQLPPAPIPLPPR